MCGRDGTWPDVEKASRKWTILLHQTVSFPVTSGTMGKPKENKVSGRNMLTIHGC